jgi:hypothetical protein
VWIQGRGDTTQAEEWITPWGVGVQHTQARLQHHDDIMNIDNLDIKEALFILIDPWIIIQFSIFTPHDRRHNTSVRGIIEDATPNTLPLLICVPSLQPTRFIFSLSCDQPRPKALSPASLHFNVQAFLDFRPVTKARATLWYPNLRSRLYGAFRSRFEFS